MILEVGGGDTKCLKGLRTTNAIMEIAEKQSKRSKKGPFSLHICSPGSPKEMESVEPGGRSLAVPRPSVSPAMESELWIWSGFIAVLPSYLLKESRYSEHILDTGQNPNKPEIM